MSERKILVTGDRGYIGSVLVPVLQWRGYEVLGFDAGYFADCLLCPELSAYPRMTGDLRDLDPSVLEGVEGIVHLAGLSNDPLGEFDPYLTDQINRDATIRLARLAKQSGVKRFVYSSSQSMYGISATDAELDEDNSEKRPLTAYARTKWEAECAIKEFADADFTVACFRPSTVFGASPRLRCDIVYNNLVACAYTTGRIEVKSDGTPWRPVVHVRDVCAAYVAGLEAPAELINARSFNVGIPNGNFTVRELAEAAQRVGARYRPGLYRRTRQGFADVPRRLSTDPHRTERLLPPGVESRPRRSRACRVVPAGGIHGGAVPRADLRATRPLNHLVKSGILDNQFRYCKS